MITNNQMKSLANQLRQYPSRTIDVFKTTQGNRILRKHIQETDADRYHKEFSTEEWIKSFFLIQIQKVPSIRSFVRQLTQNRQWQMICGMDGNVPDQSQYSRRLRDPKIHEVLIRMFQTFQYLIPMTQRHYPFIPNLTQLEVLTHRYRPFNVDCTSFKLSLHRYIYAKSGYVATEKKALPSARLHMVVEAFHGIITNYGPTSGDEHESVVADQLLGETEELTP